MKVITLRIGIIATNCYIVIDEATNECILIDVAHSGRPAEKYVQTNNLHPLAILLTHGHFDHCGGANNILTDYKLPIYCHKDDVELAAAASQNRWNAHAVDCNVTNVLQGDCEFTVGNFHIKVMHTPGHTPGSVCYFIGEYMFSGDTLFHEDIGRTDLAGGNIHTMRASLARIKTIESDYVLLPGHEDASTLSAEKMNNPYLK